MKNTQNQHGMTLIELLVAITISAVVSIFAFSLLLKGVENYTKISQETQFRDEADYLMSNLVKTIYTTREEDIQKIVNPIGNSKSSYLEIKKADSSIIKTGFIENASSKKLEVYVNNLIIPISNKNISINSTSKITEQLSGEYSVLLELKMSGKTMQFQNNIQPIPKNSNEEAEGE